MSEPVIKVSGLGKKYAVYDKPSDRLKEALSISHKKCHKPFVALDDINFEVSKGECLGIIGTNGSGKSTLLKLITGVLTPSSGTLEINGKISALLELGAGFNQEYTGRENIYLNGTMVGYSREEMDSKVNEIVEFAEIGEFIDRPVKTYSSGMFARLAFAVAINVDPDILIVDEALSVGDIFFQAKCYRKFNEFKERNKTIIFVSHDLSSVLKYCDRCLLLNKGKQISLGRSKEVVDIYRKILVNQYDDEEKALPAEKAASESQPDVGTLWKDMVTLNPNYIEYGEKQGEIEDVGVFDENGNLTNSIYKGSSFTVKMRIRFNEELENPIFAYTIKDLKGTEITGTNTMLEDAVVEKAVRGKRVTVKFTQKMPLQGGQYLISFGCTGYKLDEFVVYHRLYDLYQLQVLSDRNTVGFVDLDSKVGYE